MPRLAILTGYSTMGIIIQPVKQTNVFRSADKTGSLTCWAEVNPSAFSNNYPLKLFAARNATSYIDKPFGINILAGGPSNTIKYTTEPCVIDAEVCKVVGWNEFELLNSCLSKYIIDIGSVTIEYSSVSLDRYIIFNVLTM